MDLISWFVLGSVVLFAVLLMIGMYQVNKSKGMDVGKLDNVIVGWFIITLIIMSIEYYHFKVGDAPISDSTQSSTHTSINGWYD